MDESCKDEVGTVTAVEGTMWGRGSVTMTTGSLYKRCISMFHMNLSGYVGHVTIFS